MVTAAEREAMARPKGRPRRSERDDKAVKVDRAIVTRAKRVADYRGITLAELLSELLDVPTARAYGAMMREIEEKERGSQ